MKRVTVILNYYLEDSEDIPKNESDVVQGLIDAIHYEDDIEIVGFDTTEVE